MKQKNSNSRITNLSRFFAFKVFFLFLISMNLYAMDELEEIDVSTNVPTFNHTTITKVLPKKRG